MKHVTVMLVTLLWATAHAAASDPAQNKDNSKDWLADAGYGVFVHYLGGGPDWNDRVNSFDVGRFADQVAQTGAAYLVFTLGQNSGYYCSPNATYEKYAGYPSGQRCSRRDLPMEIADALSKKGIRLMLYLPSRSPQQDAQAMANLNDVNEQQPAPQEFTRKWSEVIREWSERYGRKVCGWWFDGSYNRDGWDDLSKPFNWNTWAAAVRAGNPDSIIAFNPGADIGHAFNKLTDQQDYTAGEQNEFGATPQSNQAQGGLQWHLLSYLGTQWGRADGPRKSDDWMIEYLRKVNAQEGAVTMDIHCSPDGRIYEPHLRQLIAIREAIRPRFLYVATDGNDTNAGTVEKPFATLEKARDTIRQQRTPGLPVGGIKVWLREGKYFRTQSFALIGQDSGEPNKPITYRAYPGEEVCLIGGRELQPDWLSPVTEADPVWSRLDPAARGQCLKIDLASNGVTEYGEPLRTELSLNGELMPLARWPDEGFVSTRSAENDITFGYDDPRPERWLKAPDAYAAGYWRHGWANRIEKIASIDTTNKKITLAKSPSYGIQANKPYYVLNLLEEIDRPGEWYLDREQHILYFWPPSELQGAEIQISTLAQALISMKDVSYVHVEGLTVEMGAGNGVEISGGRDNLVANCTIRNIRKDGITLSGENNGVTHCEIHGIGETGVSLSGGDRRQLISCGNFARDCRIHDFGRWERTYAPAIQINGVGCIAGNNLLYDGPHSAILFGGNEHLIELNEIHSVCYEVDDAGSIYCGRDWGLRGNIIRHNFFHDIKSNLPGSNGVHAVYLDDCASGITVFGNTFYQISGRAIMCGGGRDNAIENNVIAKCGSAHFTDRRGKVWIDKDESWKLLDKIKRYNYTEPPWSTRYPRLAHILDNGYEQAKEPEGCVIRANIGRQNKRWLEKNCLGACGGFDFYAIENNIEDQDPRFVDEQNLNLALRDDSPAYSLQGFQRVPFEQIGPRAGDDERVVWPLAKRAGFVADPNVLLRGTTLRETSSAVPRRIRGEIAESEKYSLGPDSVMTFVISGDHVLQPVTGGQWRLGGTLEVQFAGRYEPHQASVFALFEGVKRLEGRFDRVVLPAGWRCQIDYGEVSGKVILRRMRPDRAPAFPGAEGFGKYTLGGRGGRVFEVTNLHDMGPGSLREACEAKGPRTVVFRVSGTIPLQSPLKIKNPYITIAGQTAPGDGICVKNYKTSFEADHVTIRYMRFRLGDECRQESDSFGGNGQYVMIDHCSASWSVDETFSINKASNLTAQWCMVTESLHGSIHKKGKHGYGGLWGGPGGSWHHNILAHHASRNPRASGNKESGLMDFRNNVIYNWGFNSSYGGEGWPRNWINNYYKYGPATDKDVRRRIFIQSDPRSKAFTQGNFVWGFPAISTDNWAGGIDFQPDQGASQATLRVNDPFVVAPVRTQTAEEAFELVLKHAGASLARDAVDARIIEEIRTGTATYGETWGGGGKGIIDSQKAVGGWPTLKSTPPPADSDHDGMPDEWERSHNLNSNDSADGPQDRDGDGYTNLEEYLNSLVPPPYDARVSS